MGFEGELMRERERANSVVLRALWALGSDIPKNYANYQVWCFYLAMLESFTNGKFATWDLAMSRN